MFPALRLLMVLLKAVGLSMDRGLADCHCPVDSMPAWAFRGMVTALQNCWSVPAKACSLGGATLVMVRVSVS